MIVQYNARRLITINIAPLPYDHSHDRVTENAEVRLLASILY
jgi:hypothetical protein